MINGPVPFEMVNRLKARLEWDKAGSSGFVPYQGGRWVSGAGQTLTIGVSVTWQAYPRSY